jgi:sulfur relay (sulfurtransferase) DsrC/TusE family protein
MINSKIKIRTATFYRHFHEQEITSILKVTNAELNQEHNNKHNVKEVVEQAPAKKKFKVGG